MNSNVLNIIRFYEEYLESPFPFDFIDEMDRDMRKERKGKEKHKFLGKKINMKQVQFIQSYGRYSLIRIHQFSYFCF